MLVKLAVYFLTDGNLTLLKTETRKSSAESKCFWSLIIRKILIYLQLDEHSRAHSMQLRLTAATMAASDQPTEQQQMQQQIA